MDDVSAKSSPNVLPAHVSTVSACSTGSSMPWNQASAASASSSVGMMDVVIASPPWRSGER